MMKPVVRSSLPETRNPGFGLPGAARLKSLPPDAKDALRAVLLDLRADAQAKATECWRRHKASMACDWESVAGYAEQLAHALRPQE